MRPTNAFLSGIPAFAALVITTLLLSSCNTGDDEFRIIPSYLAVQMDDDEGWSIIDEEGNVIAEDEYDSDDEVSQIFGETYFVKSDGIYQLYSIDNPKRPLTDEEYTGATLMFNNRALVTKAGEPIQMIDAQGNLIATLPKDIVSAGWYGNYESFEFCKADNKRGWIDHEGNIVQEGFLSLFMGNGSIVGVGKKSENGKWLIYDDKGTKTGEFDGSYSVVGINDGYISVIDENKHISMLLNSKGEVVMKMKKASMIKAPYYQSEPRFVFCDKSDKWGIVNLDGEVLVRAKYDYLFAIDDDLFMAKKDDWGIMDSKEEKVISFKYSNIAFLGSNYLVESDNDSWRIIDKKGERVGKDTYSKISYFRCDPYVQYVNVDKLVDTIEDAMKSFNAGETVPNAASRLQLSPSEDDKWDRRLCMKNRLPFVKIETSYHFNDYVVKEMTHTEIRNDGWWDYAETIHDGWAWSNATLTHITILFEFSNNNSSIAKDLLAEKLMQRGFEELSSNYTYTKHGRTVSIYCDGESGVVAKIEGTAATGQPSRDESLEYLDSCVIDSTIFE